MAFRSTLKISNKSSFLVTNIKTKIDPNKCEICFLKLLGLSQFRASLRYSYPRIRQKATWCAIKIKSVWKMSMNTNRK